MFPARRDVGRLPDVAAAQAYLREFPVGPFAADVHVALATFFDDLFKAIRAGATLADDKRPCFQRFITREPIAAQMEAAQREGERHYQQAIPSRRDADWLEARRRALADGTADRWFYCVD